uniref:Uncharacterized protein n=1 Tax=Arundo donax TaxID=35708 RepID=A0A0A9AQ04_ARUDO
MEERRGGRAPRSSCMCHMSQDARTHVAALLLRVGSNPSLEIHGSGGSPSLISTPAAATPFFPHLDLVDSGGFHSDRSRRRNRRWVEGKGIDGR